MARKYSKKASAKVERAMKERNAGTLRSGRSGRKVTSRKQAIAIGLSRGEGRRREGSEEDEHREARKTSQEAAGEEVGVAVELSHHARPVPGIHVFLSLSRARTGWRRGEWKRSYPSDGYAWS